ncbi:MAG: UvrD-helicase domain-containing protein [Bdellovibrio sp.]|nr:UvrD-helicase domain-containing protein [Bdellovibrio sp.]
MSSPSSELKDHSQFIRAGAGAGKTTQLISSFLEFVKDFHQHHQRFPRVVITTFTRKATQEVKERLLVSALKQNEKNIFEYINRKSFVHISTIHGLLSLYLTQFADLLQLPQEIRIVDGIQYTRNLRKNIHRLMKKKNEYVNLLESYPFSQLIDLSKKALDLKAQHPDFKYLTQAELENLSKANHKLVIDKINQVFSLVPEIPDKWMEYFSYLRGILNHFSQSEEAKLLDLLDNAPRKPVFSEKKPPFEQRAYDLILEIKELDIFTVQDTTEYRVEHEKLNSLFFNFVNDLFVLDFEHKQRTGELTISDLENLSWQLASQHPESAVEFSDSWDYFMVDEYQDTSPLQVNLLNQLVRNRPCFIVGDPQQSIYLFRGARSEVFLNKENELKARQVLTRILDRNYRSEPSLMAFMNNFFKDFSKQFQPMQVREAKPERQLPTDAYFVKTHDEDLATLKQIQFLISEGVSAKDICVLSKSNLRLVEIAQKAQAFQIPVQLQTANGFELKREILDLISFLKFLVNPHDNENLITLLRSPWIYVDDESLFKICQSSDAKAYSIWFSIMKNFEKIKDSLSHYLKYYDCAGAALTVKELIQRTGFMAFSGLLDSTGKREANIWKFVTTLTAAEKEIGFSLGLFLEDRFQSLQSDLGSAAGEAQPVIQPDCVSLMTVHAAKGLEFKNIIVIGMSDKPKLTNQINLAYDSAVNKFSLSVFDLAESKHQPSVWSRALRHELNRREMAENERVLYVAMTRAQESISLIAKVPRGNEKQIFWKDSWYKKINWPVTEVPIEDGAFKVQSLLYDDQLNQLQTYPPALITARKKWMDIGTKAMSEQSSVTNVLSAANNEATRIDYAKLTSSLKKAQKGTELHRIFEAMKYRSYEFLQNTMISSELELVNHLMTQPEINLPQILELGHNEWGFGIKIKSGVLQGQIDAWAELEDEIHVLDYKTGSSDYSDKAFDQLALYTLALIKMKQIATNKKIVHSILYPVEKKIVQKTFLDATEFEKGVNLKLRELFD